MRPQLSKNERGDITLYVQGKPYFVLGGELHNSSSSSLDYMDKKVWPNLRNLPLNTVLLPVYWEKIEKEEGQYDFTLVDGIIKQARRENIKLILLWFALWKNGESTYVPGWVKEDYQRFFRSCYKKDYPSETISPFCKEAIAADAKAFSVFMKHLREIDGEENTVIMVQVENEIGFLGAERDFSSAAELEYQKEVPDEL
ncbi:MAG: beta-galactosidase, partial [Halanaerobiales bacterium]